jgi:hypothetical protein
LPSEIPPTLIPDLMSYISTSEIALLSQALSLLALMLQLSPAATFPEVERDILAQVYVVAHSPLLSGSALDATLAFFAALVEADGQIATHVVPSLVKSADRASSSDSSQANVAKCIAQVVKSAPAVTAGVTAEFSKHIKVRFIRFGFLLYALSCSSMPRRQRPRKLFSAFLFSEKSAASCKNRSYNIYRPCLTVGFQGYDPESRHLFSSNRALRR